MRLVLNVLMMITLSFSVSAQEKPTESAPSTKVLMHCDEADDGTFLWDTCKFVEKEEEADAHPVIPKGSEDCTGSLH